MGELLYLTLIALFLFGESSQPKTIGNIQSTGFINAEISIGKEKTLHRFRVPIVSERKRRIIDDQFAGGEWAITGGCPDDIGCRYRINITADEISQGKAKVTVALGFSLSEKDKCQVTREFSVVRGKRFERKVRCRNAIAEVRLSY